jgi:hypothetical protein
MNSYLNQYSSRVLSGKVLELQPPFCFCVDIVRKQQLDGPQWGSTAVPSGANCLEP